MVGRIPAAGRVIGDVEPAIPIVGILDNAIAAFSKSPVMKSPLPDDVAVPHQTANAFRKRMVSDFQRPQYALLRAGANAFLSAISGKIGKHAFVTNGQPLIGDASYRKVSPPAGVNPVLRGARLEVRIQRQQRSQCQLLPLGQRFRFRSVQSFSLLSSFYKCLRGRR